jgi:glycosyltransferase involved in cell wall biosynthesis
MYDKIQILYISNLCSPNVWDYLFNTSITKPGQSAQKFHRLLVEGFGVHSDNCKVETLTSLPVVFKSHKRIFWTFKTEYCHNLIYRYIPFINLPLIKDVCILISAFISILFWGYKHRQDQKVIFCDVLRMTPSLAALLASKFIPSKIVALVTDIPGLMIGGRDKSTVKSYIYNKVVNDFISSYSGYVLLTKQMNEVVNKKEKPFIIMEGIVNQDMAFIKNQCNNKDDKRIILYSGGVYKQYGMMELISAFMKLQIPSAELHIYGDGDIIEDIYDLQKKDSRISYMGIVANQEVVKAQLEATLLVNPRPSNLKLSSYSFPSKNMEYMVSGTPVVTTALPGMPEEYKEFVFLFDREDAEGMSKTLTNILQLSPTILHEKGKKAKKFVIEKKNNVIQAERLLFFFNGFLK